MNDPKPIIALCRYSTNNLLKLQRLFIQFYNRDDIYFINSSPEIFSNPHIINCFTEKNNIWNETEIWKVAIDSVIHKLNT